MTPVALVLLIVQLWLASSSMTARAQVIRLRHPETSPPLASNLLFNPLLLNANQKADTPRPRPRPANGVFTNDRPASPLLVTSQQAARRRRPRPGNVLVRFDANHDIERVEYVLRDGQLATIFTRRADPLATQASDAQLLVQTPPQNNSADNEQQQSTDNDRRQQIALEPDQLDDIEQQAFAPASEHQSDQPSELDDILATMAHDALLVKAKNWPQPTGKADKLRALTTILAKLKRKIKSKFQTEPRLIEKKLNAKSSDGKLYVDRADGGRVPVELQSAQHQEFLNNPIQTLQFQQYFINQQEQSIPK